MKLLNRASSMPPKISNRGVFADRLRDMLSDVSPHHPGKDIPLLDAICAKLMTLASDPDNANYYAMEMVMNRVDGRPSQNISVDQALNVLVELDDGQLAKALGVTPRELQARRKPSLLSLIDVEAENDGTGHNK